MRISVSKIGNTRFKPRDVDSLTTLADVITKYNYSLGTFKNNYRNLKNFLGTELIALDFDEGLTIDEAVEIFKDHAHIIAPTRNHRKDKDGIVADRFRVILKLSQEITDEKVFKHTVKQLMNEYPQADTACSDASRMFYPGQEYVSIRKDGQLIEPLMPPKLEVVKQLAVNSSMRGLLSRNTLEFLTNGAKAGTWNATLFKAAVDFLEQGYSKEECIERCEKITGHLDESDLKTIDSAYERDAMYPPRIKETAFNIKSIADVLNSTEKIEWLVDGLLTIGGISIYAGAPKCGKSTIMRQLSQAIINGGTFLDRKVKKGGVLYLALEEQEALLKEQYKKVDIKDGEPFHVHVGPVSGANIIEDLEYLINHLGVSLVVIDTFLLLAQFDNLNDYNDVYKVVSQYRNLARATGAHVMCLHHQNKGENRGANSILGSTAIQGAVDCAIVMNHVQGRNELRKLSSWQRGGKPFDNFYVKYDSELEIYTKSDFDGF